MNRTLIKALVLACVSLTGSIGLARAQPAPSQPPTMDMGKMDMGQMMSMMRGAMLQHPISPNAAMGMLQLDRIEGRIAFLKAELAITDAQLPQWNAFADALRHGAKDARESMSTMMKAPPPTTAPDRMQAMVQLMSARLGTMQSILAAARPLYAVLSDSQKKTANELIAGHGLARGKSMGH